MSDSSTPLDRYVRSMRRSRTVYYAVLGVILAALIVIAALVWTNGEAAHATLHTVDQQPAALTVTTPTATQAQAWRTADRTAAGTPVWRGTVITYSTHTVSGRDARTGARTWSYDRSDRTVCTAAQIAGVTVAIYQRDRSCDEVSAFDSGTGRRKWTRTLDENGQPVDGRPDFQFNGTTMLVPTSSAVYAIDPGSGIDRWTYNRVGCTIEHAVLGTAGVLISQDCTDVDCANVKFCGKGRQLLLRDPTAERLDDDKPNFDQITWNDIGNTGVPVSADTVVSAVQPGSNVLDTLNPADGKLVHAVQLKPAPTDLDRISPASTDTTQYLWIDGRLSALTAGSASPLWSVATVAAPTVETPDGIDLGANSAVRITVPTSTGVATLDPATGKASGRFTVPAPAAGSTVWRLGGGFLVSSRSGTVAYR